MLRLSRILLIFTIVFLCLAMIVYAQEAPAAGGRAGGTGRMGGVFPGAGGRGFGGARGGNTMVSMTPPVNVTRIKLYEKTPNVVEGTENELNPMEPTLDLY
jgi:hypothetical protein